MLFCQLCWSKISFWILTFELVFMTSFPCFKKDLVLEVEKKEVNFGHGWRLPAVGRDTVKSFFVERRRECDLMQ
jgi:hypothetical protein